MAALPRVKLSDLPAAEKERMMAFLVANQVEFKPDLSGNFAATVKVLPPQAPKMSPKQSGSRLDKMAGSAGWEKSASSTPSTAAPEDYSHKSTGTPLAAAVELRKRYKTFTNLLPNLSQHPKTMLKAELVGFIEEVYTARYNQDLMQVQQHAEAEAIGAKKKKKLPTDLTTFPQSVLTVAGKRYGLRQMVGQVCWSVAKSVEQFRSQHQGIETFARFLEESYDAVDVLFYLEMRYAARQMTMPRGNWSSWRKTPQVFAPHQRFLGNSMDTNGAASKTSCPSSRPQLTLKQAVSAVREGIDPEAPEALKASISSRLKAEGSSGHLDWDQFLAICTQEYRKARCITVAPLEKSSSKFRQVVQFARLIRQTWEMSVPDAFEKFEQEGSGVLSADSFKQIATDELGLKASKVEEIWSLLDAEKKGYVEREEWELLDVSDEADHPEEEPIFPPGWDAQLSPDEAEQVLSEAQQVASRLAASLEEHGEVVNENEVLGWALRSVLQRKGLKSRPSSTPGLRANQVPHNYASLEQMGEAYGIDAAAGEESKSLEETVQKHLASATKKLVDEALQEASPANVPEVKKVKEALLKEFLVVTDALMEALVTGDFYAWQTQLKIDGDPSDAQRQNFQDLTDEFQELLGADEASTTLVAHVCSAVASTLEVQELCHQRAVQLLEERGVSMMPATPDFPQVVDPEASEEAPADGGTIEIDDAF